MKSGIETDVREFMAASLEIESEVEFEMALSKESVAIVSEIAWSAMRLGTIGLQQR